MSKAKPFVKWAGGKGKLLGELCKYLPNNFRDIDNVTYIEPFVGGGAMLFYMLETYPNIRRVVINDINTDLIHAYELIKTSPEILIDILDNIDTAYKTIKEQDEKKDFYLQIRELYNNGNLSKNEKAAYFIFLNHTCFNGLYRENSNGKFNVPFGCYKRPTIFNRETILRDHVLLQKVQIFNADYQAIVKHISRKGYNFVYIDPPYRSLYGSSNFKEYNMNRFGDKEQEELKNICDKLSQRNCKIMISNSDSTNNEDQSYFANLYHDYNLYKIEAPRFINAHVKKRVKQSEVLITNYETGVN